MPMDEVESSRHQAVEDAKGLVSTLPAPVRWLRRLLPTLFILLMAVFAGRELRHLDLHALHAAIQTLPWWQFLVVQVVALLAVLEMVLYDWLLCRWMAIVVPFEKLLRYSWVANSFNNLIGLSGLAGSGIRYLLLSREGVAGKTAALYSGIIMLSVPVGLAVVMWPVLLFGSASLTALPMPTWLVYAALALFAAFLPIFLAVTHPGRLQERVLTIRMPLNLSQRITLVSVSLLDWVLAVLTAWGCLWISGATFPLPVFTAAFAFASALGILSLIPGGLVVLDGTLFLALATGHASSESIVAGIVLFRLVYYVIPWVIGVYVVGALLTRGDDAVLAQLARRWHDNPILAFLRLPLHLLSSVGVRMLGYLTFAAGVLLLASTVFPALSERVDFLSAYVPLHAIEGSHLLAVATGALLIALARGIADRVRGAYRIVSGLLLAGALFSLLKGMGFEEAGFLLLVLGILWARRKDFYRVSYPFKSFRSLYWLLAVLVSLGGYVLLGAALHGEIDFERVHLLSVSHEHDAARFLRSLVVALVTMVGTLGWILFRMPGPPLFLPNAADLSAARDFLHAHSGNAFSHLLFVGDKYLFYSSNKGALIQFGHIRDRLVALGDPVGTTENIEKAVSEFRTFADRYDRVPAFYEVEDKYLHVYHDLGFSLFKLGEQAMVSIADFTLKGKRGESLRASVNRATRDGLSVDILEHPLDEPTWHALECISRDWLAHKNVAEKGFSLGCFSRPYLSASPIAVVKASERIIAFANLLPGYGRQDDFSVDLLRHIAEAPRGTMDFLIVTLIEYARQHGYRYFNLGMAPLSGVGEARYARAQEKVARLAYEYGNRFYNYKGLRSFKDKFHPEWRSTYLAYPHLTPLPALLVDIAALIAGGYRRILFKEPRASLPEPE